MKTLAGLSLALAAVAAHAQIGGGPLNGGGGGGGATIPATTSVLKGDGNGNGAAATAGTDYVIPSGSITGSAATITGTQPASRVTGLAASATTDTTNAANITAGTLPHAQLPALLSADIPNNGANTTGTAGNITGILAGGQVGSGVNAANITVGRLGTTALPSTANGTSLYRSYAYSSTTFGNDFTTVGVAATFNAGGQAVLSNTQGSVTGEQHVLSKSGTTTNSENWTFDTTIRLGTSHTSTDYGYVLALKSVNPNAAQGMLLNYTTGNGTNGMSLNISTFSGTGQGASPLATTAIAAVPSVGDLIRVIFARRGQTMYGTAQNLTTGLVTNVQWTDSLLGTSGNSVLPNTAQFALLDYGGTYTLQNMRVTETSASNPNLCVLGDSKTDGVGSGGMTARYASLLDQYGPVDVFAGGGDYTAQVLASLPVLIAKGCKTLVIAAPYYNAIGFGVATATWQADYSSLVSQAKAAGMKVIHMLSIPTTNGPSMAAANSYITSTYGSGGAGDTIIDPSTNFATGTMLIADGIHPNYLGYAVVAANVIAQSGLTAIPNATFYVVPSPLALYGQP